MCVHIGFRVLEESNGSRTSDEFDDVECQAVSSARITQMLPMRHDRHRIAVDPSQ